MSRLILGIDPGLQHTGWGVIQGEGNRLVHVANGTISTDNKQSDAERLAHLFTALQGIITEYAPTEAAVEEVFVNKNAKSSLKLGQARGIALLAPQVNGLSVAEYATRSVKQAVVGKGAADKTQIGYMVNVLLPLAKPQTEDAADALAVAICHAHTR